VGGRHRPIQQFKFTIRGGGGGASNKLFSIVSVFWRKTRRKQKMKTTTKTDRARSSKGKSERKTTGFSKAWRVFLDGRPLELVISKSSNDAVAHVAECYSVSVGRLAALDEDFFARFEQELERTRRKRLPATCYHEAGHAVIAHHLGAIAVFLSTIPELMLDRGAIVTDCAGSCEWKTPVNHPRWIPGTSLDCEGRALVSLAGFAAEFRFVGRSRWLSHFLADDVVQAVTLAEQRGEEHPARSERIFETWKEAAVTRIEDLWEHVTRVANALAEHRELTRQGLERLLRPIPRIRPYDSCVCPANPLRWSRVR
jgi:hypothetical protein